ncbi:MAG: isocitrate/isopropylmalate family dehydrogenase, partial [Planctomycetota bacterium]
MPYPRSEPLRTWSDFLPGRRRIQPETCLIGVFEGDGCGPEFIAICLRILEALQQKGAGRFEIRQGGLIGSAAESVHGMALPPEAEAFCAQLFADGGVLLHGAGGGRFVDELRRSFDLYCKISPLTIYPECRTSGLIKPSHLEEIDLVIVRDNRAGVFQGQWSENLGESGERLAAHSFSYSENEVRRIVTVAANIAAARRGELTVVLKDGGVPSISDLWRSCARDIATAAGVQMRTINIDHAAYELIQNPRSFDVIVTPNLFGDILIDVSALLAGSRGLGFSGNFSATSDVYQTNGGAAHDLVGKDIANPAGQIFALAMLLRESFSLAE